MFFNSKEFLIEFYLMTSQKNHMKKKYQSYLYLNYINFKPLIKLFEEKP